VALAWPFADLYAQDGRETLPVSQRQTPTQVRHLLQLPKSRCIDGHPSWFGSQWKEARENGPAPQASFSIISRRPLVVHPRRPLMPASASTGHFITPDRALPGRHLFRHNNPQDMKISWLVSGWVKRKSKRRKKLGPDRQRTHAGQQVVKALVSREVDDAAKETPQKEWEGTGLLACTMRYTVTTRHPAARAETEMARAAYR
jgi:hypothetical protein